MQGIKKLRQARGLTQVELAEAIGVSQVTVSDWERRGIMPKADKLPKIAEVLGCSIDELYKSGE